MKEWAARNGGGYFLSKILEVEQRYGAVENLEQMFTELDSATGAFADLDDSERSSCNLRLRECIADMFVAISQTKAERDLYRDLSKMIDPVDAILTFNYDTAIEKALIEAGKFSIKGYTFPISWSDEDFPSVRVLKLHGSINWMGAIGGPSGGGFSAGGFRLIGPCVDNRMGLLPNYPHRVLDDVCSRLPQFSASATMILPTFEKRFSIRTSLGDEWGNVFRKLWKEADACLSQSDRLVIIGYSLPDADKWANSLLLETSNKNILVNVCCNNETAKIEERFRHAMFARVEPLSDPTFEGLVARS
jgi:hypothetical protein